jgi:starvation-inducible DNA-binding protein
MNFDRRKRMMTSMETSVGATHLPPLGSAIREEVALVLQQELVQLTDLALVGKQLHWTVTGELFRPLHAQLDEMVDSWRSLADTIAERIVAIGVAPNAQACTVASSSGWESLEARPIESQEVVRIAAHRLAEAAERTRDRMNRLGNLDVASQDIAIQVLRELEKQLWMVRAQLRAPMMG